MDCFNGTFQHREAVCPFLQGDTSLEGAGGDGMWNCVSPGSLRGVLLLVIIIIFKSSFKANALFLLGSVSGRKRDVFILEQSLVVEQAMGGTPVAMWHLRHC